MKTPPYDEQEVTNSFIHLAPALAWPALLAFFAIAGAFSRDEPRQMADLALAPRLASESVGVSSVLPNSTVVRDATVTSHEVLDPVGVGLNTTR